MSDLFGFINSMFIQNEFKKTKQSERSKHFFMVNRFMSIKYPVQSSYFNHIKINPAQAVTYWQENLSKLYSKTPGWMYVKTAKAKELKKSKQVVSDNTIQLYCSHYKLSRRDVEDALLLVKDFSDELIEFEKLINQ